MEVFFHGLDSNTTEKRLKTYLTEKFKFFGIEVFLCEKKRQKTFATATLLDVINGERFLQAYSRKGSGLRLGKDFYCAKSRHEADQHKLKCLQKTLIDKARTAGKARQGPPTKKQFPGSSIACGVWDYPDGWLTFVPHSIIPRPLRVFFGRKELVIMIDRVSSTSEEFELRVGIEYSSIQSLNCARTHDTSITLTLYNPPRFYKIPPDDQRVELVNKSSYLNAHQFDLIKSLSRMGLRDAKPPQRMRTTGLHRGHASLAGHCLVYQLTLDLAQVQAIKALLHKKTFLPVIFDWPYRLSRGPSPRDITLQSLIILLQDSCHYLEFGIKFQLQRLAQNAYLLPRVVVQFLPIVLKHRERWGPEATVYALQQMSKEIPYAGPGTEATNFSISHLEELLGQPYESSDGSSPYALMRRHPHLVLIHRARVTPTAVMLEGPYPETRNSVIDRFSQFTSTHFLRVSFEDEIETSLRYERFTDLSEIHRKRFQRVLNDSIDIAGQKFRFLGFSHSSLRDQACWFTAPFIRENTLVWGKLIIDELGNFDTIRSPAKCAARIGQAFTDLNDNVPLSSSAIIRVADIERDGRCFSDGCSVASEAVFHKLWKGYKPGRPKPTLFQIRYGGVKGMISLDKGLSGEKLFVRSSQEKFPSDSEMLGVCGAAKRPLPLYLNRPLIKILEDLGVEKSVFLDLQNETREELEAIAHSPHNASTFLDIHDIAKSTSFAWLVKELYHMGIAVLDDHFIWSAIELVLIMRLRDLKYRGRIPIENGATLFGVMDETGVLKEGQVYCALGKGEMIKGRVAISRSPTMHPGDIQFVQAVDVPENSKLKDLHSCVVFSQHGKRDLPSQLSGGDLDGDIFNIIADPRIHPREVYAPADYPRPAPIDIGRPVKTEDITDFFINFMSNDQLGRISNNHLQLADQEPLGTLHPDCLKLADMHSTAVDFSKTGIPASSVLSLFYGMLTFVRQVNIEDCPRVKRYKPDFMAAGPRVILVDSVPELELDDSHGLYQEDEDDILEELDPEGPKIQYYRSEKALGHLYRAIDEHDFLKTVQSGKRKGTAESKNVLKKILQHIKSKTRGIIWDHLRPWAIDIKDQYENNISDLMFANSLDPRKPLSEVEVFVGHVMCRGGGGGSRRAREAARTVRDQYNELVESTIDCILKDESEDFTEEALERSIACLSVAVDNVTEPGPRLGKLESFGYLVATICLRQVKRFSKDGF